jgi:hypothetical protein
MRSPHPLSRVVEALAPTGPISRPGQGFQAWFPRRRRWCSGPEAIARSTRRQGNLRDDRGWGSCGGVRPSRGRRDVGRSLHLASSTQHSRDGQSVLQGQRLQLGRVAGGPRAHRRHGRGSAVAPARPAAGPRSTFNHAERPAGVVSQAGRWSCVCDGSPGSPHIIRASQQAW